MSQGGQHTCHIGHHVNASGSYHPHFPELTLRRQIIPLRPPSGFFMPRRQIILHRTKTSWECYEYKSPLTFILALTPQRQTIPRKLKLKVLFRSEHGGQEKTSVVTDKPNPFRDATSREGELYVTNLVHRNWNRRFFSETNMEDKKRCLL